MNRTDRLLGIVLELQRREHCRAEDLAQTFEVSVRTIYRDIQALNEAGVPIVSAPNWGYSLMEGYFLPPVAFTGDEAVMLLLGAKFMAQNFDEKYQLAALSASQKIEAVLKPELRKEIDYLRKNISFVSQAPFINHPPEKDLPIIRRAIIEQKTIAFTYHKRYGKEKITTRNIDPHSLYNLHGVWTVAGYCHLRKDWRLFRLNRIEDLQVLPKTFERKSQIGSRKEDIQARKIIVKALFPKEKDMTRWVKENLSFFTTYMEETEQGFMVTLNVRDIEEILPWMLSWGSNILVLEPKELKSRLAEEGLYLSQIVEE